MKVFDLGCDSGHAFEGWFASEDDYLSQRQRGLLECPLCGSKHLEKRLSAPRLNLKSGSLRQSDSGAAPLEEGFRRPESEVPLDPNMSPTVAASARPPSPEAAATMALLQSAWLRAVRHVIAHTEDVGDRFADEARRIHQGDAPERGIRGQATPQEREALLDEGIEVVPLPLPKGLTGPLQ